MARIAVPLAALASAADMLLVTGRDALGHVSMLISTSMKRSGAFNLLPVVRYKPSSHILFRVLASPIAFSTMVIVGRTKPVGETTSLRPFGKRTEASSTLPSPSSVHRNHISL